MRKIYEYIFKGKVLHRLITLSHTLIHACRYNKTLSSRSRRSPSPSYQRDEFRSSRDISPSSKYKSPSRRDSRPTSPSRCLCISHIYTHTTHTCIILYAYMPIYNNNYHIILCHYFFQGGIVALHLRHQEQHLAEDFKSIRKAIIPIY
jgi:hypothetical protein